VKIVVVQALEILACFLIGAIPFAKVAMLGTGIDITKTGSKNPGFNNVLRVCREFGIRSKNARAALALVGDIAKAYLALAIFAPGQPSSVQWMMGIAAVAVRVERRQGRCDDVRYALLSAGLAPDAVPGSLSHASHVRAANGMETGRSNFIDDHDVCSFDARLDFQRNGIRHLCVHHAGDRDRASSIQHSGDFL